MKYMRSLNNVTYCLFNIDYSMVCDNYHNHSTYQVYSRYTHINNNKSVNFYFVDWHHIN